jgi:hypothetical protein
MIRFLTKLYKKSKIGYAVCLLLPLGSAISRLQRLTVPTCLPLGAEALMPSRRRRYLEEPPPYEHDDNEGQATDGSILHFISNR